MYPRKTLIPHYLLTTCRTLAMCLCLFFTQTAYANKLDSLRAALTEYGNNDTNAVNIMVQMANQYSGASPDSVMAIATRSLAISKQYNFAAGVGQSLHMMGLAYFLRNNYDSSLIFYRQALDILHRANLRDKECNTLYAINVSYYRMGKYDSSLFYLQKDLAIAVQDNNYKRSGKALLGMGDIYRDKGNYAESINSYLRALKIYEDNNFTVGKSECYRNTADIYSLIGNKEKAIEYITKANAIYQPGDDVQANLVNYTSVASVYGQVKDFKNALAYYKMGLVIADSIHNHFWIGMCLINIGDSYYYLDAIDSALPYYNAALKECAITHDQMGTAFAHRGIGNVLIKKGRAREAVPELLSAIGVMQEGNIKKEIADISYMLSDAYEQSGNAAEALKYCRISRAYNDTLYTEANDKRIQQLQFDYELKEKEREIFLLQKDKAIKQARLEKQNITSWGLVLGVLLLLLIVALLYISRQRERKNKEQSLRQRDEIQQQATKLEELNQYKDKTFSVLSHDLRGPLASFTGAMEMLDEDEITQEEFIALKPEINRQLSSLKLLLDNLLSWSKNHMQGAQSITTEAVNVHNVAVGNISLVHNVATRKMVTIHNNIPEQVRILADKGQIDVVIRNLINNAIKFTGERGRVTLSAKEEGKNVSISISDTGVGMTPEQLDKLFKVVTNNSTYGTGGEKGIGLGLLLCYEFVKANNGTITATSEIGKGSTFTVKLPAA